MSGILTTARLVFKDSAARDKAIEAFRKIIAFTTPNEPEVLQYVCALPVDDSQGNEIYMIEEYANQAASDAHLATQPVQELIQLFTTGDVLAGAPEVHNCPIRHKKTTGSPLPVSSTPAVVLLHTTTVGVDVCSEAIKNNAGLSAALVVEDKETKGVRAQYVLSTWENYAAFEKSAAGRSITAEAQETVKIRPIAGFLGREDKSKL